MPAGSPTNISRVVAARHDAHLHRRDVRARGVRGIFRRDAVLRKNLEHVVDVELLDAHAEAADARASRRDRRARLRGTSDRRRFSETSSFPGAPEWACRTAPGKNRSSACGSDTVSVIWLNPFTRICGALPCAIRRCAASRAGTDTRKLRRSIATVMVGSS